MAVVQTFSDVISMCNYRRPRIFTLLLVMLLSSLVPTSFGNWDCGERKIDTKFLIHHGPEAQDGYWPWHAVIYHWKNGEFGYACGGSIVDNNTILTSAHCIFTIHGQPVQPTDIEVHLGRTQLDSTGDRVQVHRVSKVILHPMFKPDKVPDDIALIQLASNITMTKYIQPVCIWSSDVGLTSIVGANGTIVGFGKTEHQHLIQSNHLREAVLTVIDSWTCRDSDPTVYGLHLTRNMLCAKAGQNISACNGDSGGGMVLEIGGRWFVRGLVSFIPIDTTQSCDVSKPTVFTDVARYLDWMAKHVHPSAMLARSEIWIDNSPKLKLLNLDKCGVGSNQPWMGWVETRRGSYAPFELCHVMLINEWYAVGPAHCFRTELGTQTVLLGGVTYNPYCDDQHRTSQCAQRRPIEAVIIHPKYNKTTFEHDIALIELGKPADITKPKLHPICLPVTSDLRSHKPSNVLVTAYVTSDVRPTYLSTRTASIQNMSMCQEEYASYGFTIKFDNAKLCADRHKDNKNILPGLAMQTLQTFRGRERYFLRGIDLFGDRDSSSLPTVFVNTDAYLAWILYNMKDKTVLNEGMNLLDSKTCGVIANHQYRFPWIGFLQTLLDLQVSTPSLLVTLVSEWYAITGAADIADEEATVVLGDIDLLYNISCIDRRGVKLCNPAIQRIQIRRIVNHPQYEFGKKDYDIALIEFAEPADISKSNVRPICLPLTTVLAGDKPFQMSLIYLRGWQYFWAENRKMTLVTPKHCQAELASAGFRYYANYTALCALLGTDKPCFYVERGSILQAAQSHNIGDEPLDPYRYFLRGLAYRPDSCDTTIPYIFDDIGKYIEWIQNNMLRNPSELSLNRKAIIKHAITISQKSVPKRVSELSLQDFLRCGVSSGNEPAWFFPTRFPWIGELHEQRNETALCLVTLISEWYAVAPAECFEDADPDRYTLRFGTSDTQTKQRKTKTKQRKTGASSVQNVLIRRIVKHDDYKGYRFHANIALLLFATRVDTTKPNVVPICLPVMHLFLNYNPADMLSDPVNITRYYENYDCEKKFNDSFSAHDIRLDKTTMCTIEDSSLKFDRCATEIITKIKTQEENILQTGAPLQTLQRLAGKDQYFLRGLLVHRVYGRSCWDDVSYIYSDVDYLLDWILRAVEANLPFDLKEELIFN